MNTQTQIQTLKSQIDNMQLQINNIQMQSYNMLLINKNQIGEQLLNLSIQLLNDGIQAFNIGKSMITMTNIDFLGQLQNISNKINYLINENNMEQIQNQMMLQQQTMSQQQMEVQQQMLNNQMESTNILFENARCPKGKKMGIIYATLEMKTKDVLNQYIDEYYGNTNIKINFIFNASKIDRNEQRNIEQFFRCRNPKITVVEIDS
jgi:hypothetical protein